MRAGVTIIMMMLFAGIAVDITVPALVLAGIALLDRIAFPLVGSAFDAWRTA